MKFADACEAYDTAKCHFEEIVLPEAGLTDWSSIGHDDHDNSVEIYGVAEADRLSPEGCEAVLDQGFSKIYLNHADGWETHYSRENKTGWRRKRTEGGNFLISYWPEGWGDKDTGRCSDWLRNGYMKIVDGA